MFVPYRCSECAYGVYLWQDSTYDCSIGIMDDDECEENFKENDDT